MTRGRCRNRYGSRLILSVTRFQHGRKAGGFFLPPFFGARLFEAASHPELLESLLAVELLFEPPNGFFDRLAFS